MDKESLLAQVVHSCRQGKLAAAKAALLTASTKDKALHRMAEELEGQRELLLAINRQEVAIAEEQGLSASFIDRMRLTPERFSGMVKGIYAIAQLPDPVGRSLASWSVPSGLGIERRAVPLGLIGVLYEARPNVTAEAAALCFKAGNSVLLRGGSECANTNSAIANAVQKALQGAELERAIVQYMPVQQREAVALLLQMDEWVDLLIPRGGKKLIREVVQQSSIPALCHLEGLCHTYVHQSADLTMAVKVICNAKMRRVGVCGATETVLIDRAIAPELVPRLVEALQQLGCLVRGDSGVQKLVEGIELASEVDWSTEYLEAILSIKLVDDFEEAKSHIEGYGSHHTDAIVAEDRLVAERFLQEVDSAIVMHNCSTQFADGGEFGMGAEIGIATGKLHARGPVGAEQLTTFKYLVRGHGQSRP